MSNSFEYLTNFASGEAGSNYHSKYVDDKGRRAIAVRCALELMQAKLSTEGSPSLTEQVKRLSVMADIIQEALEKSPKDNTEN
ncbi:hypothetical protein IFO68_21710 [Photobacterium sp. CAU 1568]|uniref:DUF5405 domain-containing protein n=1 Tax=Photobacterium arenosum TaxID=2774143 RepID=A0ABR9BRU2_9GAMM|nr:hypothetical protein [Photobacterium arenosum]MBD8515293.1 hypothetical protein [Photobacterium arenosum]